VRRTIKWEVIVPIVVNINEVDGESEQFIHDLVRLRALKAAERLIEMIPGSIAAAKGIINDRQKQWEIRRANEMGLQAGTPESQQ
jgi:hypothetical protein